MPSEPDGSTYVYLAAAAISFILGVVYSAIGSYLYHVNEKRVKKEAELGHKNPRLIQNLLAKNAEATAQFGVVFWGMSTAIALTPIFAGIFDFPLQAPFSTAVDLVLGIILTTLLFFIFAVYVPKKILAHREAYYSFKSAPFINLMYHLAFPLSKLTSLASDGVLRLFGLDPKNIADAVTEEEIMLMVGEGEEKGIIEENEKDMIENILEFNDTTASEIMTHRTDICAASDTETIKEAIALAVEAGRSRIPVFHEDIDSIKGILYVKDLLPYIGKEMPSYITLADIARPAYFIPESKKCSQLFSEMTAKKTHIAIIVDEYGGTSGLVTIEDLIESIVGNIQDEYDNEEDEIKKVGENVFTVDGASSIDEVSDLMGVEIPQGDYDTIAGFVTDRLGKILRDDEHPVLLLHGLEISVLEATEQRIVKLKIKKQAAEPA